MISDRAAKFHKLDDLRSRLEQACSDRNPQALSEALRALSENQARQSDYVFAATRIKEMQSDGAREAGLKPQRTYIARSVTIEPFLPNIVVHAAISGIWLDIEIGGYGSFIDDLMNPSGALAQFKPDLVLFLCDLEDVAAELPDASASGSAERIQSEIRQAEGRIESLLQSLRGHSSARLLVQGFVVPCYPALGEVAEANLTISESKAVNRINDSVAGVCRKLGDAAFFDQDRLAAHFGRHSWRDERMFRAVRLAIASEFFNEYAKGIARSIRALYFAPRKVLCTDLDNTLWGGIVGEDGPEGIATGASFPGNCFLEYQRLLKRLSDRGVLLAAVSKNNEQDVSEAFEKRAQDLALSLGDFVATKIGWDDKANSLRALAKELSLGLDSFVFVDDNPTECAAIRQQIPEILVVEVSENEPWTTCRRVVSTGAFDTLAITEDDRNRSQEYRSQTQRAALETSSASREEFLASLEIVCEFVDALQAPLSRTAQLLGKTNQFNLTTRRHSALEIERLAKEPGSLAIALRVRDRFGDAGVVGVALCRLNAHRCIVDSFLLSCRVLGRGIESALLYRIAEHAITNGATCLVGEYIPTKKNQVSAEFYPTHGFTKIPASDGGAAEGLLYEFDLRAGMPNKPSWITFREER